MTITANMSMWAVVPEMRARGFQICLAAWAPWNLGDDPDVYSDSWGIFIIGPFEGIRYAYGAEAFGLNEAYLDKAHQKALCEETNARGKKNMVKYKIKRLETAGPGFPMASFQPEQGHFPTMCPTKLRFLKWSFQPLNNKRDSLMIEIRRTLQKNTELVCLRGHGLSCRNVQRKS